MSVKLTCLIIVIFDLIISSSFTCPSVITSSRLNILQARKQKQSTENEEEKRKGPFSFISETFDMLSNLDDVVDDFYYKRMGKGEVFYGKRKYKPSGAVKGKYSGFGLSGVLCDYVIIVFWFKMLILLLATKNFRVFLSLTHFVSLSFSIFSFFDSPPHFSILICLFLILVF